MKKASVDPAFRELLLARRAEAADEIGLSLDPAEVMMLAAVPQSQLEAIIARTSVPQAHRRAFLGKVAAAMLAAVAAMSQGCGGNERPDRPRGNTGSDPGLPDMPDDDDGSPAEVQDPSASSPDPS